MTTSNKSNKQRVAELISQEKTLTLQEIADRLGITKARVGQIVQEEKIERVRVSVNNRPNCIHCGRAITYRSKTKMCRNCNKAVNTVTKRCKICKTPIETTKKAIERARLNGMEAGVYCGNVCSAEDMRRKRGY